MDTENIGNRTRRNVKSSGWNNRSHRIVTDSDTESTFSSVSHSQPRFPRYEFMYMPRPPPPRYNAQSSFPFVNSPAYRRSMQEFNMYGVQLTQELKYLVCLQQYYHCYQCYYNNLNRR